MSCLFRALAKYHQGIDENEMRKRIVDYLATDPEFEAGKTSEIVKHLEIKNMDGYLSNMRRTSTWGGALEIASYSKIFERNVRVRVVSTGKYIDFYHSENSPVTAIYWTGGHYEPDK